MKKLLPISIVLYSIPLFTIAQEDINEEKKSMKPLSREIEANFISSYYEQDGDNAAVTGGIGTEQLTDFANAFIVNIPIDSISAVNVYAGLDSYTSASSDQIGMNVSSASGKDSRIFGTFTYSRLNLKRGETYAAKVGFSTEYDYTSFSAGFSYTKEWNDANSEITFASQVFIDNWSLFYPEELRGHVELPGSNRESFNGQLIFSQILNKRTQMSISTEVVYMTGLLSTPFHRVYFSDQPTPDIERLPDKRLKVPLSLRLNYFALDNVILRTYYRYYWDDFGITGNTFEVESPIKIKKVITLTPFYRYHSQSAADYFGAFETHLSTQNFYTSDYDLSELHSHKIGLGLKYYPISGIFRSKPSSKKNKILMLKYVELRGASYERSTGLTAFIGSLNLGFGIK